MDGKLDEVAIKPQYITLGTMRVILTSGLFLTKELLSLT